MNSKRFWGETNEGKQISYEEFYQDVSCKGVIIGFSPAPFQKGFEILLEFTVLIYSWYFITYTCYSSSSTILLVSEDLDVIHCLSLKTTRFKICNTALKMIRKLVICNRSRKKNTLLTQRIFPLQFKTVKNTNFCEFIYLQEPLSQFLGWCELMTKRGRIWRRRSSNATQGKNVLVK